MNTNLTRRAAPSPLQTVVDSSFPLPTLQHLTQLLQRRPISFRQVNALIAQLVGQGPRADVRGVALACQIIGKPLELEALCRSDAAMRQEFHSHAALTIALRDYLNLPTQVPTRQRLTPHVDISRVALPTNSYQATLEPPESALATVQLGAEESDFDRLARRVRGYAPRNEEARRALALTQTPLSDDEVRAHVQQIRSVLDRASAPQHQAGTQQQLITILQQVVPRYGLRPILASLGIDSARFGADGQYAARMLADPKLTPLFDALESSAVAQPTPQAAAIMSGGGARETQIATTQAGALQSAARTQQLFTTQAHPQTRLAAMNRTLVAVPDSANSIQVLQASTGQHVQRISLSSAKPSALLLCTLAGQKKEKKQDKFGDTSIKVDMALADVLVVGDEQGGITLYSHAAENLATADSQVASYSMRPSTFARLTGATSPVVALAYFNGAVVSAHAQGTLHFWRPRIHKKTFVFPVANANNRDNADFVLVSVRGIEAMVSNDKYLVAIGGYVESVRGYVVRVFRADNKVTKAWVLQLGSGEQHSDRIASVALNNEDLVVGTKTGRLVIFTVQPVENMAQIADFAAMKSALPFETNIGATPNRVADSVGLLDVMTPSRGNSPILDKKIYAQSAVTGVAPLEPIRGSTQQIYLTTTDDQAKVRLTWLGHQGGAGPQRTLDIDGAAPSGDTTTHLLTAGKSICTRSEAGTVAVWQLDPHTART